MLLESVAVVGGIVALVVAADAFVLGAARLAIRLSVAPVVVGAVVIGFGTSSPELLVGVLAALRGEVSLAMGSVVGSNAANLTLILGIAALVSPLVLGSRILRRELPLAIAAAVALTAILLIDPGPLGGLVLLGLFGLSIWLMLTHEPPEENREIGDEALEFGEQHVHGRTSLAADLVRLVGGLAGTLAGAQALVWGASGLADRAGLSEGFIGLTLVAVGTSLPELATAVSAARRGEGELIIGNILGSCLFNGLAIAGLIALIGGTDVGSEVALIAAPATLAVTVLAAALMHSGRRLGRIEAVALLGTYAVLLGALAL